MNDYNELNKIKINLERELDRLSEAIEKIKNYIVEVENGTGEYAFWNGNAAYSSIEKMLVIIICFERKKNICFVLFFFFFLF